MALVQFSPQSNFSLPAFAAEELTPDRLMPGGARLIAAQFLTGNQKEVDAGTLVGRTFAERDARTAFGAADVAADEEIFLTAFTVVDATIKPDVTLLRHGTLIYEDLLPNWATLTVAQRTAIRSRYRCIRSAY